MWLTLIRLGASTMLARLLYPSDFGLFGMALIARELIVVVCNVGMSTGLISKKDITAEDLDTAFWFMAGLRLVMFAATYICAPGAALFFDDPRITDVMRVISVTFLIAPFSDVGTAILRKNLYFKEMTVLNGLAALIESSVAVVLAFNTELGYWALVFGMLVNTVIVNIGVMILAKWWPRLRFNRESYRYLFKYGINGLGFNIVNYLNQNIDYLLVGKLLGPSSLGLYEFSYKIPHMFLDRVARPVGAVLFPSLSKVQDKDDYIFIGTVKSIKYTTLIIFPMMFGLIGVADVFVQVLWGNQWIDVVHPLQILCLGATIRVIGQPVGAVFYCKNRPDLPFKFSLVLMVITFILVGFLGKFYGLFGVAIGMTISVIPSLYVIHFALRLIGGSLLDLLIELRPCFISGVICGVFAFYVKKLCYFLVMPDLFSLLIPVLIGALIYFTVIYIFYYELIEEIIKFKKVILQK